MSCIDEILDGDRTIIGIRDWGYGSPESNLYINDLPGMSITMVDNVKPEQFDDEYEFLENCMKMAARMVFDEFSHELSPYFDFANIIETRDVNTWKSDINSASSSERGIIIKRWRSEAARMFIERVYVNVVEAGDVTIKVIDGDATTEFVETLTAGLNDIRIDYKASAEQIKIVFDQTGFSTYDGAWKKGGCSSCGSRAKKGLYINGWDGSNEVSNTYGVGVKVHMQCYEENVLCSLLPKMYFLMWYKSGILVLKERLASSRINHVVTFGVDRAKAMLDDYELEYAEKYKTLVKGAYNYLRTMKGDCVTCNGIRYVQATP